ncbi:ABC transporter ATP-binding protein [Paenibacillus sediminis]|uniref:ABC-type multidrug transport system fused ATPase/permease subunit n=1 Tax=Paenibacillus sediminis TaxID=664909 RepID=A0ABS4GYK7_9BACL|nr:ABC transporter ATP-binding protein [Paenibacillus sediminis]MBP1935359.1 ABC-type multidrug transport system fused ATPase/permease subunit [Paenibacillus sediminis]
MIDKLLGHESIRLLSFLRNRKWRYITGLFGECSIIASQPIIFAFALKGMADSAVQGDMNFLFHSSMLLCVFILFFSILMPASSYLLQWTVKQVMLDIRLHLLSHIYKLPVHYFDQHHSGDTISRMNNDVQTLEQYYGENFRYFILMIFYGMSSSITMLMFDWRFGLALMLIAFVAVLVNKKIATPLRSINDKILNQMSVLTEKLTDLVAGIQVSKMFRIQNLIASRYKNYNEQLTISMKKEGQIHALLESADFFVGFISFTGIIGVGMILVINGTIQYGVLLAAVPLQMTIVNVFRELGNSITRLQASLAGARRIFEILDHPSEAERYLIKAKLKEDSIISMSGVSFSYDQNFNALDHLTLEVSKGHIVALIGSSGGGKSTILKLLLGFYPPDVGYISINGRSLGEYTLTELREIISYVPQDPFLFDGTIEENIRYGNINASEDELISAARDAYIHDFISQLPEGYNTQVGERGSKLSGGERQRVAIARALLKNAPILLLDEATSALDNQSEYWVQQAINRLMMGRTTIVIAHRLSTIEHADQIYVIEGGRVVEQGNHEKLSGIKDSVYKQLLEFQHKHN